MTPPPTSEHEPSSEESRPTWCDINLGVLAQNLEHINNHVGPDVAVTPVIKANAYGHGIVQCGVALQQAGATSLAVAYVEEGMALRSAGITVDIHVLGGAVTRQIPLFLRHGLTFTAPSIDKLYQINEAAAAAGARARVHLKIDTGMERIGVHHYNADKLFEASLGCENVEIAGVFSHFAYADEAPSAREPRYPQTEAQLERFCEALEFYERRSLPTPIRHIANSAATARVTGAHLDMVRIGVALFGCGTGGRELGTRPVLSWHSEVIYFKVVPPGAPVSYGGTWAPSRQTRVITLPVGYADGYKSTMSGRAQVLVNGRRCPTVGRICMDQTMVDIGPDESAYNGDKVVLIGRADAGLDVGSGAGLNVGSGAGLDVGSGAGITADDLAQWSGTSCYEVLTSISTRVPRRYLPVSSQGQAHPAPPHS